jgi:lysyl-tRNA synthetase class 2
VTRDQDRDRNQLDPAHSPARSATAEPGRGWVRALRCEWLRSMYLRHSPQILAATALLLGVLSLVDAIWKHERGRVHLLAQVIPIPASAAAAAVTAVSGLLLLRVAAGLRKRKKRAWRIAVGVAATMVVTHILRGLRLDEAVISFVFLLLLLAARSRFTAKSDPSSRWFAVRVFVQFISVALIYGMSVLYLYPHRVAGHPSVWARFEQVLLGLVGIPGPIHLRTERFGDVFEATLLGFGMSMVIIVALLVLRPSEPIAQLGAQDETRLRVLLQKHGSRDSLGYFALRRDKSVVWSDSGKAAITYRVVQGVALVSGDPIGDPEAWPGAIAAYRRIVDEYAWTPAVIGCSELGATIFRREYGLSAYELGDEAIVEVADFTLDGRAMRGVRQACTKVARAGYDVSVRRTADIDAGEFAALLAVADAWRGAKVERGFSMALSRLGDAADPDCVVVAGYLDGTLRGLLHFVPWGPDGLSLDLMRRDRSADNGLNEFLIAKLVEACPQFGVTRVSLNFAVFRDAIERGERIGAGPVLRAWRAILVFSSRWWQIESLYRFNVKFRPDWEPRFLSFPSARDLPRIAMAALEAEAFIVRPRLVRRLLGRP